MKWIIGILSIRRIISLILLLGLFIYFAPNWYIGSKISEITGTPVSAKFSLLELLRGNVVFKKLTIYSAADFGGVNALTLHNLKINVYIFSLFNNDKVINSITANEIKINSIYAKESNNLNEIANNSSAFFATSKSKGGCLVKKVFLRNIHLNTYYYSATPVRTILPAVYLENVGTGSDITKTVAEILTASFSSNINKDYENNVSWWDKTTHAIGAGVSFSVNILGVGLNLTKSAVDTANSVNSTMGRVNSSISKW